MSTSCGGRSDSLYSSANCRDSAHVARPEPHFLQSHFWMETGVSSGFPADAASLFCAQLFHWTGRGAWWRGIVLLRQRSTSPQHLEPCGPGRHGDVLVVPLASPVRRLRLRNLARRSVSHLPARSVLVAVVLRYNDIWNRVPNHTELIIYRIIECVTTLLSRCLREHVEPFWAGACIMILLMRTASDVPSVRTVP